MENTSAQAYRTHVPVSWYTISAWLAFVFLLRLFS